MGGGLLWKAPIRVLSGPRLINIYGKTAKKTWSLSQSKAPADECSSYPGRSAKTINSVLRGESIEVAVQSSLVKPAALRRSELLHRRVHRRRPGRIRSCWRSGWSGWISIWSISEEKMCFTWWMPTSLPLISLKGMARELFFAKPHSRLPDWKWYLFVRLLFRFPKFD